MKSFFKRAGDILTIKIGEKSYRPRLGVVAILSYLCFLVYLAYCIFCAATHFGTDAIKATSEVEHLIVSIFGWVNCLLFLVLGLDLTWRRNSSHVLVTTLIALLNAGYGLSQGIYRFQTLSDATSGTFFALVAFFSLWSAFYFIKKAIDGSGSWLMKTVIGLDIAFMVVAAFFSYQVLEAFAHIGDAMFWDGFMTGFFLLVSFCLAGYASLTSDYDPHPITVDELGNIIDEDSDGAEGASKSDA